MLFRLSAAAALLVASARGTSVPMPETIKADSPLGSKLLSRATVHRELDGQGDATWVADYEIRFAGCHETTQFAGEEGGNAEEGNPLYTQRLVHFYLCPAGSCSSSSKCSNGGEYVVDMAQFVDAYTEAKMEKQEYECEMVRENCYCNNNYNDDEACENQCYKDKNMFYCIQAEDEFNLQEYIECREMENQNGNNNVQYFVGPYCSSDTNSIYLGVFSDETCTTQVSTENYANMNYGNELPYSKESIVGNECISCEQVDQDANNGYNNNNNGYNDYKEAEITELCDRVYEMSGKCESNLKDVNSYYFYPNEKGCEYIHSTLPLLERASAGKSGNGVLIFFMVLFLVAALGLGYYAWTLYKKLQRSSVDLSAQDGGEDRYATMS